VRIKHHDTTYAVILHADVRVEVGPPTAASSVRTGDGGLCSFVGSADGGLPAPEAIALEPAEDLQGPGTADFTTGGGLLLPGAVDFAPPRALFTSRLGSPTLVNSRRFRAAS
jgi:hypothetical protein